MRPVARNGLRSAAVAFDAEDPVADHIDDDQRFDLVDLGAGLHPFGKMAASVQRIRD